MKINTDKNKCSQLLHSIRTGTRLHLRDLKGISWKELSELNGNQKIDIISGISYDFNFPDDKYYGPYNYNGCCSPQSLIHFETVEQLVNMLKAFDAIEQNVNKDWNDKQKAVYMYGILSKVCSHDDNVLNEHRLLTEKVGSCTCFAKIYCEMLRRQNIEAFVFATFDHAFNMVKIDENFYPIDVDSASKRLNHFFGRKNYFEIGEVSEIYNDMSTQDKKIVDALYFEEGEIEEILSDLVDGYVEEKQRINAQTEKIL